MKVLVTGSAGFIGSYVTAELESRGHTVVPFDYPRCDVRQPATVRLAVSGCEAVINLAGVLGTEETLGSQRMAADVNIVGAINVMDACAQYRVPLVQIGTGHKGQPNAYAITKGCAEDLALSRAQWLGERIAVVRAYHAYGARQIPPRPWGVGHAAKIVPVFACCALSGRPLPLNGGGSQVVDMVHASSVAWVLANGLDGPYGRVTEAGTGVGITVEQVAWEITDKVGRGARCEKVPARRGEPDGAVVVATAPEVPAAEAWPWKLRETLDWYGQHYDR